MQTYILRDLEAEVLESLANFPVTAILGPRQCGKTTLARHILNDQSNHLKSTLGIVGSSILF